MKRSIFLILLALACAMTIQAVTFSNELLKKAERGDAQAQYDIACCYQQGAGVAKDSKKAFNWFQKSAAQNYDYAVCELGNCYYEGDGTNKNVTKALEYWEKAANLNNWGGAYCLGDYYLQNKNYGEAIRWFNRCNAISLSKNETEMVNYELGLCYYSDWAGQDYAKAYNYFYNESQYNNDNKARTKIGEMYFYGRYLSKDYNKAFALLKYAAEDELQPSPDAMSLLSECYRKGLGTSVDTEKADFWLRKSIEAGGR